MIQRKLCANFGSHFRGKKRVFKFGYVVHECGITEHGALAISKLLHFNHPPNIGPRARVWYGKSGVGPSHQYVKSLHDEQWEKYLHALNNDLGSSVAVTQTTRLSRIMYRMEGIST